MEQAQEMMDNATTERRRDRHSPLYVRTGSGLIGGAPHARTPKEIDIEIARLEYGESSYPAYAKLATLYTIKNQMKKQEPEMQSRTYEQAYSAAPAEIPVEVGRYGDSEFLREIEGRNEEQVWGIMDDLMDTLQVANPRVYNGVMRKIRAL